MHGDVHMHTTESDGSCSILEMAEAAAARGRRYIAITDHSKYLTMTNGMDDARALAHAARIRAVNEELKGRIHVFAGVECDILADGSMDLHDETLAQLDIVVASVHSKFDLPEPEQTARVLRALDNPHVHILAHPTGRKLLGREGYKLDLEQVFKRAAANGVCVEHNAAPRPHGPVGRQHAPREIAGLQARLQHRRPRRTAELDYMADGVIQMRRAWLTRADVANCAETPEAFLAGLRPRP